MTMLYKNASVWRGLPAEEMAEIDALVGPSLGKSTVAPLKVKRKKIDTGRNTGEVRFYNTEKDFGFITVKGGQQIFFHKTELAGPGSEYIMAGDRVTFEVGKDRRGKTCAKKVCLI